MDRLGFKVALKDINIIINITRARLASGQGKVWYQAGQQLQARARWHGVVWQAVVWCDSGKV